MCGGAGDALAKKIFYACVDSHHNHIEKARAHYESRSEATRAAQKHAGIVGDLGECVRLRF